MKRLFWLLLLFIPLSALALVAEERPGISYTNQVRFLEKKVVENGRIAWVTLAYSDPAKSRDCLNFIDVLGGRELFAEVPEKSWVLVDLQLRSLVVESGFFGDAEVSKVVACGTYDECVAERERREAKQAVKKKPAEDAADVVPLLTIEDRLLAGRQLVKAARCRSCHVIEGFGADHAPSLTWRRHKYRPEWLAEYLAAPYRMRPAMTELMMLDYTSPNALPHLQPEELTVLVDYLQQLGWMTSPAGRFRLEPWQSYNCYECHSRIYQKDPLAYTPSRIPQPHRNEVGNTAAIRACLACHTFGDAGPAVDAVRAFPLAPDLLLTIEKLQPDYFMAYVRDPDYIQPGSNMPRLDLDEKQLAHLQELVEKLRTALAEGEVNPLKSYYRMEKRPGQGH